MSDVVNMRKQITHDGRGATIHDWLEEKRDEIDLETFECIFLRILSHLNFKTGQMRQFKMKYEFAQRPIHSSCFLTYFWIRFEDFSLTMCPGFSEANWEMWSECKCKPPHRSDIRSGSRLRAYHTLGAFTYVTRCVWWNKWDNSQQAVGALANKW